MAQRPHVNPWVRCTPGVGHKAHCPVPVLVVHFRPGRVPRGKTRFQLVPPAVAVGRSRSAPQPNLYSRLVCLATVMLHIVMAVPVLKHSSLGSSNRFLEKNNSVFGSSEIFSKNSGKWNKKSRKIEEEKKVSTLGAGSFSYIRIIILMKLSSRFALITDAFVVSTHDIVRMYNCNTAVRYCK